MAESSGKSPSKRKHSSEDVSGLEQSFEAAINAVKSAPDSDDAWDHLEDLADRMQRPDEVAAAYCEVLEGRLLRETFDTVAERAVQFHDEWFGDTPERINVLLTRIIELQPASEWAFERLVVMLTSAGQWDDLLTVYDRALAATQDPARQRRLLNDAAQSAKDFADDPQRAASYMQQLLKLEPNNKKLFTSLERLLDKQQRYTDLIELWQDRLPQLAANEARTLQVRIATVWLEQLKQPARALEVLRELVRDNPGHKQACEQLERILMLADAHMDTRREALSLLRKNYVVSERPDDVIRVLGEALAFVDDDDRRRLHREIANRLSIVGREEDAMGHYRALLMLDATDPDARKQIRELAKRSGRIDLHVEALLAAAETASDGPIRVAALLDAARLRERELNDTEGAIELYTRVVDSENAEANVALSAAHRLDELLARAERPAQRLTVLEQLAQLEHSQRVRRHVLGEAARLAQTLGDVDRALNNWRPVLDQDPHDLEALGTVAELLETSERWAELVTTLKQRAAAKVLLSQRRTDLIRVATIQADHLDDLNGAIDTWTTVREEFGLDDEVTAALDGLMSRAQRYADLVLVLGAAAKREHGRVAELVSRLGELYRVHLGEPERAAVWFQRALSIDPAHAQARAGLVALVEEASSRQHAANCLAAAYKQRKDWEQLLSLLEVRLSVAADDTERVGLLLEAAELHEQQAQDAAAALSCLCRALPLAPSDLVTEANLMRLAETTGHWKEAADALTAAAESSVDIPARAAQLHKACGAIYETWVDDKETAVRSYEAAVAATVDDLEALDAIARCGAGCKAWDSATRALVATVSLRDRIISAVVDTLEGAATSPDEWRALADAMTAAIADASLHGDLAQQLEVLVAGWYRDHCEDADAAQLAAGRAAEHGAGKLSTLELLATLQRRTPDSQLLTTLQRIDVVREHSLDPLYEAATVALQLGDSERVPSILERLYRKSAGMWLRDEPASGEHAADEIAQWALDQLIEQHILAGDNDRAVNVLLDGTRLPLPAEKVAALRRRAADMLTERRDFGRAISVYRRLLNDSEDAETTGRVAALCEQQGQIVDALTMRHRELALVDEPARKLQLRLDCSRLTGMLEARGGRVESLRQNLADAPGHAASIEALAAILEERGRYQELATLFEEQAEALASQAEQQRAAATWQLAANVCAEQLKDTERAIKNLTHVVMLAPNNNALDALARLHTERAQHADAARWLQQRLDGTAVGERVPVLLKLARSRIAAEQREGAVEALSSAFEEAPRNAEVRKLLLRQHRANKNWQALADTLAHAALNISDEVAVLEYAREAAELYHQRLNAPDRSVAVLRKAISLAPGERKLRAMLAEGLRLAGELDEAKALLEELIKAFGRRRSAERAQAHLQLARVTHAQGDVQAALDQLEIASKMDSRNVSVLKTLADLAQEAGELDRAERAYRTLLVTVRRESDGPSLPTGPSEVLLELSRLAAQRGDQDKAEELLVSALETLAEHDYEAERIQQRLSERGDHALLLRVLKTRAGYLKSAHRRAQVLADTGSTLLALEKPDEALECLLSAVKADPSSPVLHQRARDLALQIDKLDRYVPVVEALLSDDRADKSAHVRCELLLRLGEVLEKDHHDLDRAAELYAKAESTGVRRVDVWRAEARIAGARGDGAEQMRLLELLASLGEDEADTRAAALYRIAEVQLASDETLDEGLVSLNKALSDDFRAERAAMILHRAAEHHPEHPGLLDTYEQVARRSGDDRLLLHYLQLRARQPDATAEHAREAVEKAIAAEEPELAEALMLRAADIGKNGQRDDDLRRVDWALLGLAERRLMAGDMASAVKWLSEAAEVAALDAVFALAQQVLELANQPGGDLTLASKLYERLLEQAPTERRAWEPLANIYARLDAVEHLERLVEERLDGLEDVCDRNALRVALSRALLRAAGREEDAVELLKTVLFEEAANVPAQGLLVEYLEKTGKADELIDLLNQQLDNAEARGDGASVKAAALRLAKRVEAHDRDQALNALRRAVDANESDLELLYSLYERLTVVDELAERATIMERMLALEPDQQAGARALELVEVYAYLQDDEGVLRALKLGTQRDPDNTQLRERLMNRFRELADYAGLAQCLEDGAAAADNPRAQSTLLREAAQVHRDHLDDATKASELLRQAFELSDGDDFELSVELARTLSAAGEHEQAITAMTQLVDNSADDARRLWLLRVRAQLLAAAGDEDAALADLEQAFQLAPHEVAEQLEVMLQQRLDSAAVAGDEPAEREFTLRCVEVLLLQAKREQASELLGSWVDRSPDDVQALRRLRDLDTEDGRWQAVADTSRRLVAIETGSAQVDAALALAHAYYELGEPEGAREGLEYAREHQPENVHVRAELRKIYERLGDRRQLAVLLMDDASTTEDPEEKLGMLARAGQLFVEVGDTEAALPALREALVLNPDDLNATLTLVDAYILAGWYDDANELLDGIIEEGKGRRTPELCLFHHRKAHIAGALGDRGSQLQFLQEAHLSSKKNGIVAADLANLAEEMEDWDLAAKTLRTITLIDGECPISRAQAFLRQGRISLMQGDEKSARMWARRARREEPDSADVEAFMQQLGE